MKTVVKILISFEVPDDPAARWKFREVVEGLKPYLPADGEVRDFKMVEDGSGRLLDKWEGVMGSCEGGGICERGEALERKRRDASSTLIKNPAESPDLNFLCCRAMTAQQVETVFDLVEEND